MLGLPRLPVADTMVPSQLITKANAGTNDSHLFKAFSNPKTIYGPVWGN